jgi:hypothetical protein
MRGRRRWLCLILSFTLGGDSASILPWLALLFNGWRASPRQLLFSSRRTVSWEYPFWRGLEGSRGLGFAGWAGICTLLLRVVRDVAPLQQDSRAAKGLASGAPSRCGRHTLKVKLWVGLELCVFDICRD